MSAYSQNQATVHCADDFESKFCNSGFAFRVTNSLDWVPQAAIHTRVSRRHQHTEIVERSSPNTASGDDFHYA